MFTAKVIIFHCINETLCFAPSVKECRSCSEICSAMRSVMMNFCVAVVTIGMSVSMTQAGYTYTIDARMPRVNLPAKEMSCNSGGPKCWLLRWEVTTVYQMTALAEIQDNNGEVLYESGSVLDLCRSHQNGTWEQALRALLLEAIFPTKEKWCNFNGEESYFIYEKLQPVTITMNDKLNCSDYHIESFIAVDDEERHYTRHDFGSFDAVYLTFTITDGDNCNRL